MSKFDPADTERGKHEIDEENAEAMANTKVREYRGVIIWPKNYCGMYSARVDVPGGGQSVAADTLEGIRALIRHYLSEGN